MGCQPYNGMSVEPRVHESEDPTLVAGELKQMEILNFIIFFFFKRLFFSRHLNKTLLSAVSVAEAQGAG